MSLRLWILSGFLLSLAAATPVLFKKSSAGDILVQRRELARDLEALGFTDCRWRQVSNPRLGHGVEITGVGDDRARRLALLEVLLRDPARPDFVAVTSAEGKGYFLESTQLSTHIDEFGPLEDLLLQPDE